MSDRRKPSAQDLSRALAMQMESVCANLGLGSPRMRTPTELRFNRKGSLCVHHEGPWRGRFKDFEADVSGDALDLVRHILGGTPFDAIQWAKAFQGGDPALVLRMPVRPASAPTTDRRIQTAMELWKASSSLRGTLGEAYLNGRGLGLPDICDAATLRFHRSAPWRDHENIFRHDAAMVALMRCPVSGQPTGVHRTFLTPQGHKHPEADKRMLGAAGAIFLAPDDQVTQGLVLTEGIETGLAVAQRFGMGPVWATGSAAKLGQFPVLPGIEGLTVMADHDVAGCGHDAAQKVVNRYHEAGRDAKIYMPETPGDWADDLPPWEADDA